MPGKHAPEAIPWALDGRETDLLHYIFSRPDLTELRNHPKNVLAAIDDYSQNHNYLMNIGPRKGAFIFTLITERKPSVMIELGGYVGYSAILFGETLRSNGGKQYLSLEINPEMAAVATILVQLAGLQDIVSFIIGPCDTTLMRLAREKRIDHIELLFIDHWQDRYLPDLLLVEELDLLKPGVSLLVADNVLSPGAPKYAEWVRASTAEKREMTEKRKLASIKEGLDSVRKDNMVNNPKRVLGNPNLVYESSITEFSFGDKKDGVEVTRVVGEENS